MLNAHAALSGHRIRRRGGFSLVEIAMVLAIVALLVAGVMLFFANANTAQRTNDALQEVSAVNQAVQSLYSGQPDYAGVTAAVLVNSKQIAQKWVRGTTQMANAFGGAVTVAASAGSGGVANTAYTVTFSNVPAAACAKLATTDFGSTMNSVAVNGGAATAGIPLTPVLAGTQCNSSTSNSVVWVFN